MWGATYINPTFSEEFEGRKDIMNLKIGESKLLEEWIWRNCRFQTTHDGRMYCILKEIWCSSGDCKEQMI